MPARRLEWAVAGGMTCLAIARLAGADRIRAASAQTVPLVSVTPCAAALAWLGAGLIRDRRAAVTTMVAAGAMSAAVLPRVIPHAQPAATGPVLRVLTANLLLGRAPAEPVVRLVRSTGADVLLAQELTRGLASDLSLAGLRDLMPHALVDVGAADSRGNAIYSRHPLAACQDTSEPAWARPAATVELPGGKARLACVHLHTPELPWTRTPWSGAQRPGGRGPWLWRDELRSVPGVLPPGKPPVIIAGDFNATADHAEFRRLLRHGYADAASQAGRGLTPTWGLRPGGRPGLLTIDHVLVESRCAVLGTSVHRLPGTDHRALLAVVRLP